MQTPLTHILSTPSNPQNSPLTYLIVIEAKRFVKQILPQRPERLHCQCFPLSADDLRPSGAFRYVLAATAMCRRSREGMIQCFTICYKVSLNRIRHFEKFVQEAKMKHVFQFIQPHVQKELFK